MVMALVGIAAQPASAAGKPGWMQAVECHLAEHKCIQKTIAQKDKCVEACNGNQNCINECINAWDKAYRICLATAAKCEKDAQM
jgi:hypothetical protein